MRVEDADNQLVKQEEMDIELDQTVRALRKFLSLMADRPAAKIALFYMDNQVQVFWDEENVCMFIFFNEGEGGSIFPAFIL